MIFSFIFRSLALLFLRIYLCCDSFCKKRTLNWIFIVFFAGVEAIDCNVEPKNNEARIKKAIFCNYDKSARPTLTDGMIKLKFKMIVKGFNFDSSSNKLTVSTWLAMVMNRSHSTHNQNNWKRVTCALRDPSMHRFQYLPISIFVCCVDLDRWAFEVETKWLQ